MIFRRYLHTEPTVASSYLFGCGGQGLGAWSTLSFQFAEGDRAAFIAMMLRDIPPRPPRAEEIRKRNLGLEAAEPAV